MPINQRVLVVDDDAVFAEAIGSVLRQAGFKVDTATHFAPALKILEDTDAIDLLIIDLVMPSGINGIALSRMACMRRPGLRIIYITGHDIPGIEREAVGPVLRKPLDNDMLIQIVEQTLVSRPEARVIQTATG